MKNILIVGYGNSLAGDDALGYHAVKMLDGSDIAEHADIKYVHQLMPEHSAELSEYETVIFIDAEEGTEAGKIKCKVISEKDLHDTSLTAHEYTLDSILLLAKKLYRIMPKVFLITVTGSDFSACEKLSPAVENALPQVIEMISGISTMEKAKEKMYNA